MGSISIVKHPPSWPQGLKERKRGKREQRVVMSISTVETGKPVVAGYNEISLKGPLHVGSARVNKNEWLSS